MIGLIGAMETEVKTLIAALEAPKQISAAGCDFYSGKLCGKDAVVVMCGIGKVAAAICTQALIDHFHPDVLINTGVAGGLESTLEIGDIVVATDAVQHDFDLTAFGYAKGYMPAYGKDKEHPSGYPADAALIEKLTDAAAQIGAHSVKGRIASGDVFVSSGALKHTLISDFSAAAAEMEGAAIAQVAYANGIPFAILRAISDLADKEANISFDEFEIIAAERSAALILQFMKQI